MEIQRLIDNLQRLMKARGTNPHRLSSEAGIGNTYIRDILRGRVQRPSHDNLAAIAAKLGVSVAELLDGRAADAPGAPQSREPSGRTSIVTDGLVGDRDFPVYACAQGGPDGSLILSYEPIEMIRRPGPLIGVVGGFAMYIVGDSMSPRYEHGDLVLVHPTRPARAGDDVLVILRHNADDGARHAMVKQLIRRDDSAIKLRQFNPRDEFTVKLEKVSGVHQIVGRYNRT